MKIISSGNMTMARSSSRTSLLVFSSSVSSTVLACGHATSTSHTDDTETAKYKRIIIETCAAQCSVAHHQPGFIAPGAIGVEVEDEPEHHGHEAKHDVLRCGQRRQQQQIRPPVERWVEVQNIADRLVLGGSLPSNGVRANTQMISQ